MNHLASPVDEDVNGCYDITGLDFAPTDVTVYQLNNQPMQGQQQSVHANHHSNHHQQNLEHHQLYDQHVQPVLQYLEEIPHQQQYQPRQFYNYQQQQTNENDSSYLQSTSLNDNNMYIQQQHHLQLPINDDQSVIYESNFPTVNYMNTTTQVANIHPVYASGSELDQQHQLPQSSSTSVHQYEPPPSIQHQANSVAPRSFLPQHYHQQQYLHHHHNQNHVGGCNLTNMHQNNCMHNHNHHHHQISNQNNNNFQTAVLNNSGEEYSNSLHGQHQTHHQRVFYQSSQQQEDMDLHPTIKQQQEQQQRQQQVFDEQQNSIYSNIVNDVDEISQIIPYDDHLSLNQSTHYRLDDLISSSELKLQQQQQQQQQLLQPQHAATTQLSINKSRSNLDLSTNISNTFVDCANDLRDSQSSTIQPRSQSTHTSYVEQQRRLPQQQQQQENSIINEISSHRQRQDFVDMKSGNLDGGNGLVSQDWLDTICHHLIDHLNRFGICVIDNFLGPNKGDSILKEVQQLYSSGQSVKGKVVSSKVSSSKNLNGDISAIRNDRVIWVEGSEDGCGEINNLIQTLCSVITNSSRLSLYSNNGLDKIVINKRTKAHVACYPGNGTRYIKHVDNPNNDGRVITSIYYINKDWNTKRDGGLLRMFPAGMDEVANIEPLFDRVLFFWSDRRNPHEVLPAYKDRFAITVWYIGQCN